MDAKIGSLKLALTTRGASGALYRLRFATFEVDQLSSGGGGDPVPVPIPGPPRPPPFPGDDEPGTGSGGAPAVDGGVPMGGSAGTVSTGGRAGAGGGSAGASMGGFAGTGMAGAAGSGTAGSGPAFPVTFLSTENDPTATTLETNLAPGQYLITLFEGWQLEKVELGEVTTVAATLVSNATQDFFISVNEESFVSYRFETNGEIIDFGQGRLIVDIDVDEVTGNGGNDPRPGVMENNVNALGPFFSLEGALSAALANAGSTQTALDAYHAIIDSYATNADGRDPNAAHCDDQLTGGSPSLNGFSLMCPRLEAQQFDNIGSWFPTAVSNRLDLAPVDGANCGQQRIIFANNQFIGNGRMFIIMEAQIPNPHPECGVSACRPIAEFWDNLSRIEDASTRGILLADAFLSTGVGEFGPFMNAQHLGPDGGQVRTNNFNDFIWTLREFHFQPDLAAPPLPVPVAESPNGQLWNDLSGLPQGAACRQSFLNAVDALVTDTMAAMAFPVAEQCKDAESRNDFEEDYPGIVQSGSGDFLRQLDARGAPFGLSGVELASRARFAGSCMGCHTEANGLSLGHGLVAPFQNDFVHVSESQFTREQCFGGTCFGISEALRREFLPHRRRVVSDLVAGPSCGGSAPPPVEPPPAGTSTPPGMQPPPPTTNPSGPPTMGPPASGGGGASPGGMNTPSVDGSPLTYTLGGQLVGAHPH